MPREVIDQPKNCQVCSSAFGFVGEESDAPAASAARSAVSGALWAGPAPGAAAPAPGAAGWRRPASPGPTPGESALRLRAALRSSSDDAKPSSASKPLESACHLLPPPLLPLLPFFAAVVAEVGAAKEGRQVHRENPTHRPKRKFTISQGLVKLRAEFPQPSNEPRLV